MSELRVYSDTDGRLLHRMADSDAIQAQLQAVGAIFQTLPVGHDDIDAEASQDEVIERYRELLDDLMLEHGFAAIDVLTIDPGHPRATQMRQQCLREHTHSGVEGRLCVRGAGLFYLRAEGRVYGIYCERGDFVAMPAQLSHWLDIGDAPDFCSIRLFASAEGWDSVPTGSNVSHRFPSFEAYREAGR